MAFAIVTVFAVFGVCYASDDSTASTLINESAILHEDDHNFASKQIKFSKPDGWQTLSEFRRKYERCGRSQSILLSNLLEQGRDLKQYIDRIPEREGKGDDRQELYAKLHRKVSRLLNVVHVAVHASASSSATLFVEALSPAARGIRADEHVVRVDLSVSHW